VEVCAFCLFEVRCYAMYTRCRHPVPDYYNLTLELFRNRTTRAWSRLCTRANKLNDRCNRTTRAWNRLCTRANKLNDRCKRTTRAWNRLCTRANKLNDRCKRTTRAWSRLCTRANKLNDRCNRATRAWTRLCTRANKLNDRCPSDVCRRPVYSPVTYLLASGTKRDSCIETATEFTTEMLTSRPKLITSRSKTTPELSPPYQDRDQTAGTETELWSCAATGHCPHVPSLYSTCLPTCPTYLY